MAKKARGSMISRLEETVSDMANAVSVAATGSEIGILELAAEDELNPRSARKTLKATKNVARKKKGATKTSRKPARKKSPARRRAL